MRHIYALKVLFFFEIQIIFLLDKLVNLLQIIVKNDPDQPFPMCETG